MKITTYIPPEATPGLKPSVFYVTASLNGTDLGMHSGNKKADGHYEIIIDEVPDPTGNYCVTLGVYIAEDSTSINPFTDCISI